MDLSHAVLAEWKATISAALASSSPMVSMGVDDIADIAVEVGFQIATARVPDLVTRKAKEGAAAFDDLKARFEKRHHEAIRQRRAGELTYWIERARKLLVERNLPFTDSDPQFTTLVDHLATSGTDTFAYAKAYMDGSEHLYRPSSLVATVQQRGKTQGAKGEGITELYERYAVQRLDEGRQRPDTINQGRKVISLFVEFVGKARAVNTLKSSDVREWRNTIKALPPAFRARKENRNLSLKDAANLAVKNGLTGISIITVNKYLSTLSPFLDWVRQEGYADINPCDGLFYDVQKIKRNRKRPPFEPEQMNAILKSPLFSGFSKDGKEWLPGDCHAYDWRRWIPLVCMFTGARIGEIAQLCFGDVCEEDGIPFLWLKHDEKTGQTNKSGQSRPSVIHTKLRQLGFLEFVKRERDRRKAKPSERIFSAFDNSARGQVGAFPSRFWRTYLSRIGVKSGADGLGAHSFRHGLVDQLRMAGYLDHEIAVVVGNKEVSVTARYGKLQHGTIRRIATILESAEFKGVDFSVLS